ncbi:MAG: PAS domain S-box protein [Spirochaetes bacterium]|nr:MAG: PAS domain S-box protein [Spirochaetota bacterium]
MNRLINRLLKKYDEAEYITALKARLLLYLCVFGLIIIPVIVVYTAFLHLDMPFSNGTISYVVLAPTSLLFLVVILAMVLLVKGYFTVSAHIIFSMTQSAVWMVMYFDQSPALSRLNSVVLTVAIMAMAPLVISRRGYVIAVYAALNIAILYFFMNYQAVQLGLSDAAVLEHFADTTAAILLTSFISFSLFRITSQALNQARVSGEHLAVSNAELTTTNEELQATMEELEAANEEFEAQNEELTRVYRELEARESLLSGIVQTAPVAIVLVKQWKIAWCNQAVHAISGYTQEETLGRDARFLYYEEDDYKRVKALSARTADGAIMSVETRLRHRDGREIHVQMAGMQLNAARLDAGIVVTVLDITERRRADADLRASRAELLAIFNGSHDAFIIYGPDGRVLDVNDRMLIMFGLTREQALACTIQSLSSPDSDMEGGKRSMLQALAGQGMVLEWKARRPHDGSLFDAEVWIKRLARPGGHVLLASVRDISARKWAEKALKESERSYRMIAENAVDIIFTMDMDFRFTYISPSVERVRGYTVEEAMAQSIDQALTPASLEVAAKAMAEARLQLDQQDTNRAVNLEMEEYCKNGTTIWTENEFTFLKDERGVPVGILGVTRNISERRKTQEMLLSRSRRVEKQMKAIGRIASSDEIWGGDFPASMRTITEIVSDCFEVERTGIWLLNDEGTVLRCEDLFERTSHHHSSGLVLDRDSFREQMDYLVENPYIDAYDAMHDPRTRGYRETFLVPNGITSMLDASIKLSGKSAGVLCLEQVGPQRSWFDDEILFACTIADQVVQVLLYRERARAAEALRESENSYRMLSAYNERLNEIFVELTEAESIEGIFEKISASFRSLTGATAALSSRYDPETATLRVVSVSSEGELARRIDALLGRPVFAVGIPVPAETIPEMLAQDIRYFNGLEEFSFGAIPAEISRQAMDMMDCGRIVTLVLRYESELLGTAAAFLPRGSAIVHTDAMRTFSYLAGLSITRKNTELALRQSTERLQTVVASAPLVLFALNEQGVFTLSEGAGLGRLGLEPGGLVRQSIYDVYRTVPELLESARMALGGTRHHREVRVGELLFEAWFNPVRDSSGRITGCMGVAIDITDRKKAEEDRERMRAQLIQAQKMEAIGTLAGGIAHDFNNMLGGIMGSLDVAGLLLGKETLAQRETITNYLETALESSRRAADLTRQMLTLSRKKEIQLVPVDITHSLANVRSLCENGFPKSVAIRFDVPPGPLTVRGDPTHIEQVFLNLCVNASHAMTIMRSPDEKQGGALVVDIETVLPARDLQLFHPEADPNASYARIRVRDTGVGMDEDVQQRIFEPFYSHKKREEGTGLGLAMVYSIVKQHRGFIEVVSAPGTGTLFMVYLPLVVDASSLEGKPPGLTGLVRGSGVLLVIDDEKSILRIARGMLEHCGYEVLTAGSAKEGIALFEKEGDRIAAVILDLSMPGMSGIEAYEKLREMNPGIRVLLTSGLMEEDSMKRARALGIREFLQKPYSAEDLSVKVAEVLRQ